MTHVSYSPHHRNPELVALKSGRPFEHCNSAVRSPLKIDVQLLDDRSCWQFPRSLLWRHRENQARGKRPAPGHYEIHKGNAGYSRKTLVNRSVYLEASYPLRNARRRGLQAGSRTDSFHFVGPALSA